MRAGSVVRAEWPRESEAIAAVITAAFSASHRGDGGEAAIVAALRSAGDLALSLVATDAVRIIGHAAFSPVTISDGAPDWYGLGPVAVLPEVQGLGIGSKLIRHGIEQLKARGARGIVVLGNPDYYGRFGFTAGPDLVYPGAPQPYFQALVLSGDAPRGEVRYAPAFG